MFKRQSAVRSKGKPKRRIMDPTKRMLVRQLLIGFALFSLVGLILTLIWYGTRISPLTITEVTASGGETIDAEVVRAVAAATLEGTYFGLVPKRFAWWYPEEDMYAAVSQIPRIKNPVIDRISGTMIAVTYAEYVPYALWCIERTSETCLFVDHFGYAFGTAPKLSGGSFVRYHTLGKDVVLGGTIADADKLATIAAFIDLVKTGNRFQIAAVETDTAGDVFYIVAGGGEFKASLRDSAEQVYNNLDTIVNSPDFTDIRPGSFQYIDLRFGNKVFVNEEKATATSTAASSSATTLDDSVQLGTSSTTH